MAAKRSRSRGDGAASGPSSSAAPARKHSGVVVRAPLVLLADGDARRRVALVTYLAHAGFRVVEAVDTEEARAATEEHGPTVALVDLATPGDALALCRELARVESGIAVVALGASTEVEQSDSRAAGCVGHLPGGSSPAAVVRVLLGAFAHPERAGGSHEG